MKTPIRLNGETYLSVEIAPDGSLIVAESMNGKPLRLSQFPPGEQGAKALRSHIKDERAHLHVCIRRADPRPSRSPGANNRSPIAKASTAAAAPLEPRLARHVITRQIVTAPLCAAAVPYAVHMCASLALQCERSFAMRIFDDGIAPVVFDKDTILSSLKKAEDDAASGCARRGGSRAGRLFLGLMALKYWLYLPGVHS